MASNKHLEWLQVLGSQEPRLLDPGRISLLARELSDPTCQYPSSVHLVGNNVKSQARRALFPDNNFGKGYCDGVATLRADNSSILSENPIFFAESNPDTQNPPLTAKDSSTCMIESFPIQWGHDPKKLINVLHARLFCLFTDVICIFADDFTEYTQVIQLLESWAATGSASFNEIRPRVIIVRGGVQASPSITNEFLKVDNLHEGLSQQCLKLFFSSIKVLHLAHEQISSMARFRRLKELILTEINEMRIMRKSFSCLYSAIHISSFFRMAVAHTAASLSQPFDFISASRRGNEIQSDFADHLFRFLKIGESYEIPREAQMKFISLNILQDAYPPKMHRFDPKVLYDAQYCQFCLRSLTKTYGDNNLVRVQNDLIRAELVNLVCHMVTSGKSAIQIYKEKVRSLKIDWLHIKSNQTCLSCLRRVPENTLSCGHAICDICVRNIGDENLTFDCQYRIEASGLRILSLDGGGTRGVIIVEFMEIFQRLLGKIWRIQDLFDSAYGTSVGGLIILNLFLCRQQVSDCAKTFDTLARQLFPQSSYSKSIFSRLRHLIRSWYYDGCHDPNVLEACLKKNFGSGNRLFGHSQGLIATKVGVTAATIQNGYPILLTNYNGLPRQEEECGYKVVRSQDMEDELFIWQAGRMTSAAPVLYPPAYSYATGRVQDGGMSGHNNPVKLAHWEVGKIEPSLTRADRLVSLGTGTRKDRKSERNDFCHHVFFDGFIPRLWRAYMSSFNGETNFSDLINCLDVQTRKNYNRLNVFLPDDEPAIDNTSRMAELRHLVRLSPQVISKCKEILYSLLVATFYFELSCIPTELPQGRILCTGIIRCRVPGKVIVNLLNQLHPLRLSFVTHNTILGTYRACDDLCRSCSLYQKKVQFIAQDLEQLVNIQVRSEGRSPLQNISVFPQNMKWFIDQQHLDAPFGTAYHKNLRRSFCKLCSDATLKRKSDNKQYGSRKKRTPIFPLED
ncbi:hypothetical protein MMC31_001132 [Peltigera leucophlebia]|nr:hypothetical protein [Peltigera leucophlebia]